MSIPNGEFFHTSSYGYYPNWYNGYDPAWLIGSTQDHRTPQRDFIELKVPLCCEGCVDKVYKKLNEMDGVTSVQCYMDKHKVTVTGTARLEKVLKKVREIKPRSEYWRM